MRNLIVEWLLGTICLFIGSIYLLCINPAVLGATDFSVGAAFGLAFLFYLITGYLWIGLVPETIGSFNIRMKRNGEEMPSRTGEETPSRAGPVPKDELALCGSARSC